MKHGDEFINKKSEALAYIESVHNRAVVYWLGDRQLVTSVNQFNDWYAATGENRGVKV